ncbi:MAG: PaaI family thioesterase [Actinomycetota bacterium]
MSPLAQDLRSLLAATPLYSDAGITLAGAEPGLVAVTFTPRPAHLNVQGLVHGGLLALLADTSMGLAVRTQLPAGRPHVTVQLGVQFLRPAPAEGALTATGRATKVGRTLAFGAADITAVDGSLIAVATATISVAEPRA